MTARARSNDAFVPSETAGSKSYTVNGLNQYTAVSGAAYAYDSNGNLTSDGSTTYAYDAENRLVSASNGTQLAYDPLGRLWQTSGGPWGKSKFLTDGDQLAVEYDGDTGAIRRRFMFGPGVDESNYRDSNYGDSLLNASNCVQARGRKNPLSYSNQIG